MFKLTINKGKTDTYYYIQTGTRIGEKVSSHTVKKIGKASELKKHGIQDPEAYARQVMEEMEKAYAEEHITEDITIDYGERIEKSDESVSASTDLNTGYFFLQYILGKLKLKKITQKLMEGSKAEYNAYDILRFLICTRILDPGSKLDMCRHMQNYFEQPDFEYQDLMRFLDKLDEHYDEYIEELYAASTKVVKRDQSIAYYDCTNFYFEIECEDAEYVDEVTGEIITGLRFYGVSKENRPNPIAEMGLFIDGDGLPITMCIEAGNTSEQSTAIPLEKQILKMYSNKPFIYCADAGIGSYDIRKFNSFSKRAFVITQSIKKLSTTMQDVIFTDSDYHMLDDEQEGVTIEFLKTFDKNDPKNRKYYNGKAYKVFHGDVSVILNGFYDEKHFKNGNTQLVHAKGNIKQDLIVTFSRKLFEYQRFVRARQIERAKELLEKAKDPEDVKKGPHDIKRFIKRKGKAENKKVSDIYEINEARIAAEEKYDGFYCVATNLDVMTKDNDPILSEVQNTLHIVGERYKIEENFRIMKTNFKSRPVYHRKPPRIRAHFLICYSALLVFRLLEKMLKEKGDHFTVDNLTETMRNVHVAPVKGKLFTASYRGSKSLTALCNLTNIDLTYKNYQHSTLLKTVKKIL